LDLLDKKGNIITDPTEMFKKTQFREFLTSLIMNPKKLNSSKAPGDLYGFIKPASDRLNYQLKDIK